MTSTDDTFPCFCPGGPRRTRGGRCIDCDGLAKIAGADLFADVGRCGGCQATIGWVTSRFGKPLALDLEPHPEGTIELHGTASGVTIVRELEAIDLDVARAEEKSLYREHRESCPTAGRFKRGARRRRGSRA